MEKTACDLSGAFAQIMTDPLMVELNVRFRPVEERDIHIICRFPRSEDELFFMFPTATFPLTPAQLRSVIAVRSDSTVIETGNAVAGFANFYRWDTNGVCAIGNVIVAPEARGRGIGRRLIEEMVRIAFSKHSAAEVRICCFNQNAIALLLYAKLGFRPYSIEERQDRHQRRLALIGMRLPHSPESTPSADTEVRHSHP